MGKCFLFILLTLFSFKSYTQTQTCEWERCGIGNYASGNGGKKIKVGTSGNIFVFGEFADDSVSFGPFTIHKDGFGATGGIRNSFVVKYDQSGNVIFAKSLCAGSISALGFDIDVDENFYVTGRFSSDSVRFGSTIVHNIGCQYCHKMFLAKFDSSGNSLWVKSNSCTGVFYSRNVSTDGAGNVYCTAFCTGADSVTFDSVTININENNTNVILAKFDTDGNPIWIKVATGDGDNQVMDVAADLFGNVFITGRFTSADFIFDSIIIHNNHPPGWWTDIFIAKYDSSGNVIWAKSEGGQSQNGDGGWSVTCGNSREVYLAGYYSPNTTFDTLVLDGYGTFLAAFATNGKLNWLKTIHGNNTCLPYGICTDVSGNIYITGYFNADSILLDSITIYNTPSAFANPPNSAYLAKYDRHGNIEWAKNGSSESTGIGVCSDNFGNIFLTGSFSFDTLIFDSQILTVGNNFPTTFTTKFANTTGIEEKATNKNFILFPNPANFEFTITSTSQPQNTQLEIYSLLGKKLRSVELHKKNETINIESFPSGIYIIKVSNENVRLVQKLVKR